MNWIRHTLTHWMTSSSGVGLAVLQVVLNGRDKKTFALAVATAILGALAKDPNKH